MAADEEAALSPPPDLAKRELPIEELAVGLPLVRIHQLRHHAIYFGKADQHRFDDPLGKFGVCYAARSFEGAFVECFLREVGATALSRARVEGRMATSLVAARPLKLVQMHSEGLARVGATSLVASGPYSLSRPWARQLYKHPSRPDGLVYRSRHGDHLFSVALFDRAASVMARLSEMPLRCEKSPTLDLLEKYGVGLLP